VRQLREISETVVAASGRPPYWPRTDGGDTESGEAGGVSAVAEGADDAECCDVD
jgi:hypothetical protein